MRIVLVDDYEMEPAAPARPIRGLRASLTT
jgi:hypothetical protein